MENKYFNTPSIVIYLSSNIQELFTEHISDILLKEVEDFTTSLSGWTLKSILFLKIFIGKYTPFHHGSSYIELPLDVKSRKACINVKNYYDEKWFKWSILAGYAYQKNKKEKDDDIDEKDDDIVEKDEDTAENIPCEDKKKKKKKK